MERIKQAIEKDKKLHAIGSGQPVQPRPGSQFTIPPNATETEHELEEINYKHTRVVKLQMEHLEKNRIVAFNKNNAMSMNIDLLRTQVLQKMKENGWRTRKSVV